MKPYLVIFSFLLSTFSLADTPPPGTVKAKTYSGDGNTAITSTGSSLNVNVTNSGGLSVVDQGAAGVESWLVAVTGSALPTNACQESGGHLASIDTKLTAPLSVSGTFWQTTQPVSIASPVPVTGTFWQALQPVILPSPLPSGTNTIGAVNINGTVPISGTITATNSANGPTASPVPSQATQVGGVDGLGDLRALKVSTAGVLSVDGSSVTQPVSGTFWQATQPVSGTVTSNAGTGTFNVDASGFTVPVSGTFWQATQPVSGTVTSNAGTGTFTVDGSGHTQPVSGTFWQATQPISAASPIPITGSISVANTANGPTASPVPSEATQVGGVDGSGNLRALKVSTAGVLSVDGSAVTQPVSGTFWQATQPVSGSVTANAGTGTFTVDGSGHTQPVSGTFWQATQPISGTVTANIGTSGSLALDASVTGLQVSQGSTTSGQKGDLSLGAVTSAAPTYTTAQTSPLSLTTAGGLRIDGSATTQPVSLTTLPALTTGSAVIGRVSIDQTTPGTTNLVALAANQSVNVAQINATTPLMGNGTTGTGSQRVTIASDNTAFTVNSQAKTPTALTVKQAALTIGTSAARLTNDGAAPVATRVLLIVQLLSTSTANCYLGSSGVTTTSTTRGIQMFAGQTLSFSNDAGDYYAICDSSSQTFLITEQE